MQQSGNKAGWVATLCKCTCITGSQYLPEFPLWKPFSERLPAVCVASRDGEESSAAYVHQFLFPSGENWCWNVLNAASSFWRVLPKLIKDIWVVFLFQKWVLILWRWPLPMQAVHLPHQGDRGMCARNLSRWPTSDYQRGCRGCWNSIWYMPENSNWRIANETCVSEICVPFPDGRAEGRLHVSLHWPPWASPKWYQLHVLGITGDESWVYGYDLLYPQVGNWQCVPTWVCVVNCWVVAMDDAVLGWIMYNSSVAITRFILVTLVECLQV